MWYHNPSVSRASWTPEYCSVMQVHSDYGHVIGCRRVLGIDWQTVWNVTGDSHLEFRTYTRVPWEKGACLWSCVFQWVWSVFLWAWLRPAGTPAVPARPCGTLWRVCEDTASHTSWWAPSEPLQEEISHGMSDTSKRNTSLKVLH